MLEKIGAFLDKVDNICMGCTSYCSVARGGFVPYNKT